MSPEAPSLEFLGLVGAVMGSKILLTVAGHRAHIDHSGFLPRLIRQGRLRNESRQRRKADETRSTVAGCGMWRRGPVRLCDVQFIGRDRTCTAARGGADARGRGVVCRGALVKTTGVQSLRDREYAACLLANGYRISMPFRAGLEHTRSSIGTETPRSAPAASADLAACETAVARGRTGTADVAAGQAGLMRQGVLLQVRAHSPQSPDLTKELVACLRGRGYEAK